MLTPQSPHTQDMVVGRLSFVLVCKNNEKLIGRTLETISPLAREFGGEVIALDNGSTDGTLAKLAEFGARIVPTQWMGYIKTKQAALEASRSEWTFCVDSDESLEEALVVEVRKALNSPPPGVVAFRVNRKMWYRGAWLNFAWQPEWRVRLVRRGVAIWGGIDPHDKLDVLPNMGTVADLPRWAVMRHDSMEGVATFLSRQVQHSRLSAEGIYARGGRSSHVRMVTSACGAFLKQIVLKQAFRDGWRGWVAAVCMGIASGMKHAILIELQNSEPTKTS